LTVAKTPRYRVATAGLIFAFAFALANAAAPAALDVFVGARNVVANEPISACSSQARNALNAVLQNAFEAGQGTGQWLAYGPADSSGHSSATAAIHCFPLDSGYVVTFTCAVDIPPNPDSASALCAKLATAFGAKTAALAR
jgi:hypothetical protein